MGQLSIEVEGPRITVTMRGTCFRSTYVLAPDSPTLRQSNILVIDGSAGITSRAFEILAWEAANAKARELGWIV
jgi:hypothetical protein